MADAEDSPAVNLSGLERTAILFLSLGKENAAKLMKNLNPKEVQSIGLKMSQISKVSRKEVEFVLSEFVTLLQSQTSLGLGMGSSKYIKDVLNKALGEGKASNMIDRILLGGNSQGLESLKWMDATEIAEVIRLEHPQIISIVLSYIEPEVAADVLKFLPENIRGDLMMRVATLDDIPPVAFRELDNILEKHFSSSSSGGGATEVGGVKKAAKIITFLEKSMEEGVMTTVTDNDEKLAQKIKDLMFVFDDLIDVEDRGIQTLLRDVSTDLLTVALKGAEEELKTKILKNMSKRASEMLIEDMEVTGPVKLSDVEVAQKEILAIAKKLEEAGDIQLSSGGDFV
jgi:flagellar motor switch protein FliG